MNELNYRTASQADIKQLQQLRLLAYGQFKSVITKENWEKWELSLNSETNILNLLDIATCFVSELESEIVGMAFFIPHGNPTNYFQSDDSYIRLVGVHPKFEGKGIGRKLTQQCIDFAKESGEEIIALHTSEFQNAARHIYESLGFVKQKNLDLIFGKQYYLYTLKLK